jgi:integral membrane sensor domain MASE1
MSLSFDLIEHRRRDAVRRQRLREAQRIVIHGILVGTALGAIAVIGLYYGYEFFLQP